MNIDKAKNPSAIHEEMIRWARYVIAHENLLEESLEKATCQAVIQECKELIKKGEMAPPTTLDEIQQQILPSFDKARKTLLLADLNKLKTKYFQLSGEDLERIDALAKARFPSSDSESITLKDEIAKQIMTKRECSLARRVQPWCAQELKENVNSLIEELNKIDSSPKALQQADTLLKLMAIQARKKQIAHIIGIISTVVIAAGLILALTTCPYLIVLPLLLIGGSLSLTRTYFASGYWNSRGWHFQASECVPVLLKWAYRKITGIAIAQKKAWGAHVNLGPPRASSSPIFRPLFTNTNLSTQKTDLSSRLIIAG